MEGTGDFKGGLEERARSIADACTRCGKCFEVCPMVEPADLSDADSEGVLTGIVDILRAGDGTPEARKWAEVCSYSGFCLNACDYGVDPRLMLILARLSLYKVNGWME